MTFEGKRKRLRSVRDEVTATNSVVPPLLTRIADPLSADDHADRSARLIDRPCNGGLPERPTHHEGFSRRLQSELGGPLPQEDSQSLILSP